MELETMTETKKIAIEKWREYRAAEKISANPMYRELKTLYNQIKAGKKIIDIFKAIKQGGEHEDHSPKLAVARADAKKVVCTRENNGRVDFKTSSGWNILKQDVTLKECLPKFILEGKPRWEQTLHLEAPVPLIPPKFLPKKLTSDYYILWEVDEWKMVPPTDPWLLRRVTKTLFVVLDGWDLTELEKAVMAGRL